MGLIADVYKHKGRSYDAGRGYGEFDEVTLVNVPGPFDPAPHRPAAMLVRGNVPGAVKVVMAVEDGSGGYVEAQPDGCLGPMMGGCYVSTSDSRLGEAVERLGGERFGGAVPLHDRWETPAEYAALSA